jgi:hypothetical protein
MIEWRVSPQVFSDIHATFAKHGIGLGFEPDESMEMFGRLFGPDAAAMELIEKYNLRAGIPLMVVVDRSLTGSLTPNYEEW